MENMMRRLTPVLVTLLVCVSLLPPVSQPAVAQNQSKITVELGEPNVWWLGQAHYLLSTVRERSLKRASGWIASLTRPSRKAIRPPCVSRANTVPRSNAFWLMTFLSGVLDRCHSGRAPEWLSVQVISYSVERVQIRSLPKGIKIKVTKRALAAG
jgi:hypothetical protein